VTVPNRSYPNTGEQPNVEGKIDIKYRNGIEKRGVLAKQYRWKPWPEGPHAFDISRWQLSEKGG